MVFNLLGRNQDDHTKNIAYLMDKLGRWRLSPAFDVIYAWNPDGAWTSSHQMSVNGRVDRFTRRDLMQMAERFRIKHAAQIIEQVATAIAGWAGCARAAGVDARTVKRIGQAHRHLA
jgi:serine/threonine-protein kinase HipA